MTKRLVGVIGGSGLGARLSQREDVERLYVDTPFGPPSAPLLKSSWNGVPVVFLNRHGEGHIHPPSSVPYRANIFALKLVGVTHIIASGAVGSLNESIQPGHLVVCDQVIDKTFRRAGTFFDEGIAVHAELADPFCGFLRRELLIRAAEVDTTVHADGTYVVMEGPQFSTRAESHMHRMWGGDLIGMTCMPEARLAREAEICYAMVSLATDYDCWRSGDEGEDASQVLATIIDNLNRATEFAIRLIEATVCQLTLQSSPCACQQALDRAIWTDKHKVPAATVRRLQPLIGRHFADTSV